PVEGFDLEWFEYRDEAGLTTQTARAITRCLQMGFEREQIVVLSMRGLKNSKVLHQDQLATHTLRHFTGRYSDTGDQLFSDGSILTESVYRFKGQAADAVILTELDFEQWDEKEYRKLFVGLTRAKLFSVLVGSPHTLTKLQNTLTEKVPSLQASLF
ncbi:MAG: ATP-binding domain-containing protein, partial [Limnobacter sp.]|nr:ATP-binding domain-containing protein [Limnobacter sp.]